LKSRKLFGECLNLADIVNLAGFLRNHFSKGFHGVCTLGVRDPINPFEGLNLKARDLVDWGN
jgi:hypothetical protein